MCLAEEVAWPPKELIFSWKAQNPATVTPSTGTSGLAGREDGETSIQSLGQKEDS